MGLEVGVQKGNVGLILYGFPGALMVKNPPANIGGVRATGSIPGWGRSPEKETATHSSILASRTP